MAGQETNTLISVVLPVRNGGATIGEAVASVFAQSWRQLELIVIDGGSTDSTTEVLSTFADRRLSVISCPNSGPARSRNLGIATARGDFVAFIDADDVWLPEKLEAQMAAFERMPEAVVAYCWTDYMSPEGLFVCPDGQVRFEGNVYEPLLRRNFIDCGSIVLARRKHLTDAGGFDESLPVIEDWEFNLRLAASHPFACVPQVLVRYRQSASSMSSNVQLMDETFGRVIEMVFEQAPVSSQHLKKVSTANFYEYLGGKAVQGVPTRERGIASLRFFGRAARTRPQSLLECWRRPWSIKSFTKALLAIALPRSMMQSLGRLFDIRPRDWPQADAAGVDR